RWSVVSSASSVQRADADVAVPHEVAVVLQADHALAVRAEAGLLGEFAGGHARVPVVAALLVLGDLDAVEPVLDVRAVGDDADLVPLTGRARDVLGGGVKRVDGAGGVGGRRGIGVAGVVEHLHLGGGIPDVLGALGAAVEDAAVAAGLHLPLEHQLAVAVRLARDDVAAVAAVGAGERAVLEGPAGGEGVSAVAAPVARVGQVGPRRGGRSLRGRRLRSGRLG